MEKKKHYLNLVLECGGKTRNRGMERGKGKKKGNGKEEGMEQKEKWV